MHCRKPSLGLLQSGYSAVLTGPKIRELISGISFDAEVSLQGDTELFLDRAMFFLTLKFPLNSIVAT